MIENKTMWMVSIEDNTNIVRRYEIDAQEVTVINHTHKTKQITFLHPKAWRSSPNPLRKNCFCCARDWNESDAELAAKRLRGKFFN